MYLSYLKQTELTPQDCMCTVAEWTQWINIPILDFTQQMIVRSRAQILATTQVGQPSRSPSGEDKLVAALLCTWRR